MPNIRPLASGSSGLRAWAFLREPGAQGEGPPDVWKPLLEAPRASVASKKLEGKQLLVFLIQALVNTLVCKPHSIQAV